MRCANQPGQRCSSHHRRPTSIITGTDAQSAHHEGGLMQISKDAVLALLRDKGHANHADQAEQELPDQVDTDQHSDLLSKFDLDPKELLDKFGGNLHL
jgi:hypothetical protein